MFYIYFFFIPDLFFLLFYFIQYFGSMKCLPCIYLLSLYLRIDLILTHLKHRSLLVSQRQYLVIMSKYTIVQFKSSIQTLSPSNIFEKPIMTCILCVTTKDLSLISNSIKKCMAGISWTQNTQLELYSQKYKFKFL